MVKVRVSYTAKEKLAAISYSEAHGNRAAGREFGVNEANIRVWRNQKDQNKKMPKTKHANRDSKAHFPEIEAILLEWLSERRKQGISVSSLEMRLQALIIARQLHKKAFRGSADWSYSFMRRHDMSSRRRTHIAQKLPEDYEEKLTQFQRYVINLRRRHGYSLSQIGNADQTPLTFDLPAATTIAPKGAKSISINTTGNEKNRFTVMLGCTADGGKLPPFVIFKRKTLPRDFKPPKGIHVRVQEKGWMNDALVRDWIANVWEERPGADRERSMLVLDAFCCYKSNQVKRQLSDSRTNLVIIPGGMTSILQPLDVSINKAMKTIFQRKWNEWYNGGSHTYTSGGRMRKAGMEDICTWIVEAWQEIEPAIIVKAFKKCCISNAMDGTEDDMLWEEKVPTESHENKITTDYYDDMVPSLTAKQIENLLNSDDDEPDFEGFEADEI